MTRIDQRAFAKFNHLEINLFTMIIIPFFLNIHFLRYCQVFCVMLYLFKIHVCMAWRAKLQKLCPEASWNVFCTVVGVCLLKVDTLVLCTYVRCSEGVGVIYSTYFYYLLITENHRLSTLPYVNFVNVCLNRFTCVTLFESLIWLKGRGQMFSRLSWHVFDHGVNV